MNPAHQALARKLLIGVAGVTVVAAVGFGVWSAVVDRPPKFARVVAADFPADTVGMFAFADPAHSLELLEFAVSARVRAELTQKLELDPLVRSSWAGLGVDLDAPVGFALTDIEDQVFVVSLGLADADKARKAIQDYAAKAGVSGWTEREFAGVDGMWLAKPAIAVVFRDERLIIVASEDSDTAAVETTAETIAKLSAGASLAGTPAFRRIHRLPGDPILLMFANIGALDNLAITRATVGPTNVESIVFALTSDDRDIHFISQTQVGEDNEYLDYLDGRRSNDALDRVPGPVYAGTHWTVDPKYLLDLLDEFDRLGGKDLEREVNGKLGVSVRDDVVGAWTGEFGALWTGAGDDRWGGVAFAGVRDEARAQALLEQAWSRTDGVDKTETDAGTLYRWDERAPVAAKVYAGQLWFGVGGPGLERVDDDAEGFRKTTESEALADLLRTSGGVGFVDLLEVRKLLRTLPDSDEWLEPYANVIDELEALTLRSAVDGQTFTGTMTLHTTVDDAFDTLTRRLVADIVEQAGDELLEQLGARDPQCRAAVDHMIDLAQAESGDEQVDLEGMRAAMLGLCEDGKFDPECVVLASRSEQVDRCMTTPDAAPH